MHKIIFAVILVSILSVTALTEQTSSPASDPKARAQEIIKQARAAIWDESKSKPLQSLSINATSRRSMGGMGEMTSEVTVEMLLPDKFLNTSVSNFGTNIQAINGTQTWADFKPSEAMSGMGGGGGDMIFTRQVGDGHGGGGGGGGGGGPVRMGGGNGQRMVMGGQAPGAEFGRLLLSWLLIAPAPLQAEFAYFGEAKAEGKTADVIDVTGPNNFAARLFIDRQTHQLLVMSFKTKMPRMMMMGPPGQAQGQAPGQAPAQGVGQAVQGPKPAPAQGNPPANTSNNAAGTANGNAGGNQGPTFNGQMPTPEEIEKMRAAAMANAPEVEVRWYLSDYRNVSGLNLPHTIIKSVDGQTNEQIDIKKVKVNPSIKADKFVKKEEKK